jgi:adenylate cyclase
MKSFLKCLFSINPISLTFCSILFVVILFLVNVPILDMIELRTYDLRLLSRQARQPTSSIVLAIVDEKSLDTEGRWPWPRSTIAALVDRLSKDQAKVIAFDIGFLEPDENTQLQLINELGQHIHRLSIDNKSLSDFIQQRKQHADNDQTLADAIQHASAHVILGYFFHMGNSEENYQIEQRDIDQHLQRINASKYPLVIYEDPNMDFSPFIQAYAPESNIQLLTGVADASGYFDTNIDPDGIVRWMPMMIQAGQEIYPPLAVLAAWHYLDKPQLIVDVGRYGVEGIKMGERYIPTNERGQMLINYLGPVKTFPYYSISDILSGKLPQGTFKDKIVVVGATATGTYDMRSTPMSPVYPGPEIHASVIDNILTQHFLTKPDWSKSYDLIAITMLGILVGIALSHMGALKGLIFAAGLFVLHVLIARWLFGHLGAWLNLVYPLLALSTTYLALTVYYYVTEERERQKIKGAFTHYVSAEVIDTMLADPARLKLGGDEKVLTVLFSDLQGFTAASERYTPTQMIELLSEYYALMTEQVFDYGGMLKEYVGDELMAIFGAPVEQADHAKHACAAALAMRDNRAALREAWGKLGRPYLHARTGINSGLMLVGNLGSKYRFAYGVLGDHVNLGSRLEGLNKAYQTEILIGENTAELIADDFLLREIDMVQVVGREQAVRIYELLGRAGISLPPEQEKAYSSYAAGLEAYRQQYWDDAIGLFSESLSLWKGDGPSLTMLERCEIYQKTPPPENWEGVFEALYK